MQKKEEVKLIYFFLLPIILLFVGFYVLMKPSEKIPLGNLHPVVGTDSTKTVKRDVSMNIQSEAKGGASLIPCCGSVITNEAIAETEIDGINDQLDEAYQSFLLASIIFIVLLILPRLKELTISKGSISLELIEEVQKDFEEVQALVSQVQNPVHGVAPVQSTYLPNKFNEINKKIEVVRKLLRRPIY